MSQVHSQRKESDQPCHVGQLETSPDDEFASPHNASCPAHIRELGQAVYRTQESVSGPPSGTTFVELLDASLDLIESPRFRFDKRGDRSAARVAFGRRARFDRASSRFRVSASIRTDKVVVMRPERAIHADCTMRCSAMEQLVMFGGGEVLGINPATAGTLWSAPHQTEYGLNISTPVRLSGNRLLISSAYNNRTRLLKLSRAGGKTTVAEQWYQNRMRPAGHCRNSRGYQASSLTRAELWAQFCAATMVEDKNQEGTASYAAPEAAATATPSSDPPTASVTQ